MNMNERILMIVTSNGRLGGTDKPSGYWAEELAAPYRLFESAGMDVTIASPLGGSPPLDPMSLGEYETDLVRQFLGEPAIQTKLTSLPRLEQVAKQEFTAVFVVGGFGVMWDLTTDAFAHRIVEAHVRRRRPVAAVCHAPALFAQIKIDGAPLLAGKSATGFSNAEEEAVSLGVDRLFVENELRRAGATYQKSDALFAAHVVRDGLVLTGQNPASSSALARQLLDVLRESRQ